ncbi:efflux RND transporter periplasmic adaptor subunit [Desulforhabdus amnigena]|uniref:RND transporter n=1 Tax=Desulforhabdus amnigena TaxID=40218 RepID=A0A9W6CYY2_9BACT|nr:HlyD family efflux transporter periplasmic adaptor subunit [Desulforhabdus amnigena]NLJ29365.1 HlyD family efflux transporter periplasmic adaptor subunit [Deltaproteobacteria bacterium]GLI34366.1 RND transporter [Desulforhabdus amnigena]
MKKFSLIFILIIACSAVGFFLYKKFFPKSEVKVLESAKVERGNIRGVLVETGIIKSQVGALVKIGARITGTVVQMNVKIGDRVKKGDLIALIDDREILQSIQRQRAALASAQNTLLQVERTYPERIKEARASFTYNKLNYEREQQLIKKDYTTADAVDKARSDFNATQANLKRLQEEYKTQGDIARANVDQAAAQIKQLEVNLSYTRIYAPIDGLVSDVTIQEGETIVTGLQVANLVTVIDPTLLEMWIYVDETDVGKAKTGQSVEYYVDTYPDRIFHGTIHRLNPEPVVKDNIVYYLAIVQVPKDDAAFLKPEMTSHVKIIYEEKRDILTAPNAAVKFEAGKQIAYKVIGPNKVEKLELKTGIRGEEQTEIVSGATEGEVLATKIILPVSSKP